MGNLTTTKSGEIASFFTGKQSEIRSLKVHFSPKQAGSGDPSPENVREITGWSGVKTYSYGKNLFNPLLMKDQVAWNIIRFEAPVGTVLTMSTNQTTAKYSGLLTYFRQPSANQTSVNSLYLNHPVTQTVGESGYVEIVQRNRDNITTYSDFWFQIEIGSTATTYQPYQGYTNSYQLKLPDEYQEVEYIESTGTQWINTGIIGRPNIKVESNFALTDSTNIANCGFIGSRENSGANRFYIISFYNNKWHLGLQDDITSSIYPVIRDEIQDVIFQSIDGNYSLTVDGAKIYSGNSTFSTTYPMYLFGVNNYGTVSRLSSFKLYTLKIQQDGNYIRDFIPCYRKLDNEIGLYDLLSQTFYTNQGTGSFLKGEDVDKTFYGGYVDLVSGELVEEWGMFTTDEPDTTWRVSAYNRITINFPRKYIFGSRLLKDKSMCTILPENHTDWNYGYIDNVASITNPHALSLNYTGNGEGWSELFGEEATNENVKSHLQELSFAICATLVEPITHQLTPTQLSSFIGQNNIWSNADYVEVEYDLIESNDLKKVRKKIIMNSPHIETASGDVASFSTDMKAPLKSCKVYFNPIQNLNGQNAPYPSGGGKNLFNKDNNNWTTEAYLSSTGEEISNSLWRITDYIPVNGTVFTLSNIGGNAPSICLYDENKTFLVGLKYGTSDSATLTNVTVESESVAKYARFSVYSTHDTSIIQLEMGSSATEYAPYSNICPITGWTAIDVHRTNRNLLLKDYPSTMFYGEFSTGASTINNATYYRCFCFYVGKNTNIHYQRLNVATALKLAFADSLLTSRTNSVIYNSYTMTNRNGTVLNSGEHPYLVLAVNNSMFAVDDGAYDTRELMIDQGTGTVTYESRQKSETVNIDLTQAVTTAYGGYVDVATGELTITKVAENLSEKTWSTRYTGESNKTLYTTLDYFYSRADATNIIAENYSLNGTIRGASNLSNPDNISTGLYSYSNPNSASSHSIYAVVDINTSAPSGLIVYDITEPIKYQLTNDTIKTLKGNNSIFSDANGGIEVKYWTH